MAELPDAPSDDLREPREAVHETEPAAERLDPPVDIAPLDTRDSSGNTAAVQPAASDPDPPQVDLDLGAALYRQAAAWGGFTPESVAAVEVRIEQAVTRQAMSNAVRLHALADQIKTMSGSRAPAPSASGTIAPAQAAPPPRVDVARARAVSAQIWHETREDYDAPAQTQRR